VPQKSRAFGENGEGGLFQEDLVRVLKTHTHVGLEERTKNKEQTNKQTNSHAPTFKFKVIDIFGAVGGWCCWCNGKRQQFTVVLSNIDDIHFTKITVIVLAD
jgi:hypothetical protein